MVPLTASSPMSPPGKKSGLTTNESVVTAMPDVVHARKREHGLVTELVEHRVAEDVAEERGHQRVAGLPSRAVAHRDRVLAKRRLALANLGDALEHALLGVGDAC